MTDKKCGIVFSHCKTDPIHDPIFLSESGIDISRTDIPKYPDILKLDEKMRSLFWVPEEINLTQDIQDFKTLNDNEKRIFTETLLRATMLDSIQGRSPSICFLPICSNPELELAIETWSFFETIHSKSYSYIIKNIYPDPTEVFDKLKENKGIVECADSISEYYDNLINYNAMLITGDKDYDKYKHKEALVKAITAVNALEAIRFYSAFAVFFNFAENSLMQGNAKILQMIARDESLHVGITTRLLKILPSEDDDYKKIYGECLEEFANIYNDVVKQEIDWVYYIFRDGGLLGLSQDMLIEYIYYLARQKIRSFGIPEELMNFPVVKSNPLPWINNYLNTANVQAAPQEIEIINYQTGAIDSNSIDDLEEFTL